MDCYDHTQIKETSMYKYIVICACALAFLCLFACTPPAQTGTAPKAEATEKLSDDQIIAWVNNSPVPKKQMDEMIAQFPPYLKAQLSGAEGIKNMADNIIGMELVHQTAVKEGFEGRQDIKDQIELMRRQVIASKYLEEAMAKLQSEPDEAAMRKFYDATPQLAEKDFEEVKGQIAQHLARQNQQEQYKKIVDGLKATAEVRYNDAVLDSYASAAPAAPATMIPGALTAPKVEAEKETSAPE
jgi:hypothetical protein